MPRTIKPFRDVILSILSGILLVLPFHYPVLAFLAFVAFIPFFYVLRDKTSFQAFSYSYLFGITFFLLQSYSLMYVSVLGYLLIVLYLALYFAIFGGLTRSFLHLSAETPEIYYRSHLKSVFFIPAIWVMLEYSRGWVISGIPWALLAYSQWKNIPFIQIADITGAYGISFVICFSNVILFKALQAFSSRKLPWSDNGERAQRQKYLANLFVLFTGILTLLYLYGLGTLRFRERFYQDPNRVTMRVSSLQGNIPQEEKWNASIKNIVFEKYKRLMMMSALEKTDLVVWPETSFPGYLEDEPLMAVKLRSAIRQCAVSVLVGAPTLGELDKGLKFYNSAVLFGPTGEEVKRYGKMHLVPFGEYMPLEPLLGFVRNFFHVPHFSPGKERVIFESRSHSSHMVTTSRFGVLICFEDLFPGTVRSFCREGADFLLNITNDAWFGKTSAPYQHAQSSVFRAVENRVNVVRAANTGYSCFISPEGRILSAVEDNGQEIFVSGHKTQDLVIKRTPSFYTRFGDVFILLIAGLCFLAYQDKHKRSQYSKL